MALSLDENAHRALADFLKTFDPKLDADEMARELLLKFGSVASVLNGEPLALLRSFPTQSASIAMLTTAYRLMVAASREQLERHGCLADGRTVVDYLRLELAGEKREVLRMLLLDAKLRLIVDEVVALGSIRSAPVPFRDIIRKALECGAAAIILGHNHPSGDPTPSREDVAVTRRLRILAEQLDLSLVDHVIVAGSRWSSMAAGGLL